MLDLAKMGKVELRAACKEHGIKNYSKMDNEGMRAAISAKLNEVAPVVETVVETVVEPVVEVPAVVKNEEEAVAPTTTRASSGLKIEKDREERNGIKRPSIGGQCRAIWDFCDAVHLETGILPTISLVKEEAANKGWNANNASIEFYQWRKFNGIIGRVK